MTSLFRTERMREAIVCIVIGMGEEPPGEGSTVFGDDDFLVMVI